MTTVKVYSTPSCPFCVKTKEFLKQHNIEYVDLNVAENEELRNEMIEKSDQMSVPVTDIDGEIIIGFDEKKLRKTLKMEG